MEREEKLRIEREKIEKMKLEKEKLEQEIKEIRAKKEQEKLIKENLEKERIEKEKIIKEQIRMENEEKKKLAEQLEKELREKLTNEFKEKYEQKLLKNNSNLLISSEVNNFIASNKKFLPERLKLENENYFVMEAINNTNKNININNNPITNNNIINKPNDLVIEDIALSDEERNTNNNNNKIPSSLLKNNYNSSLNNSLQFSIVENNNNIINNNKEKNEDSFELQSGKNTQGNKDINSSSEEEKETVLELNESKKKLCNNYWKIKNKSKNKINEILEVNENIELIKSIDDEPQSKKVSQIPVSYNNYNEQPINIVSEVSTNQMRHISNYDLNINSSTRKFEPKELDDVTGSMRFGYNSIIGNQNINLNFKSMSTNNLKTVDEKYENNNENNGKLYYFNNEYYKDTIPNLPTVQNSIQNESNVKDQKMKLDDLEQSKLLKESQKIAIENLKNSNNIEKDLNQNKELIYPNTIINNNKNCEKNNISNFKLSKIIKYKDDNDLNNIMHQLKQYSVDKNNNNNNNTESNNTDESTYILFEKDNQKHSNLYVPNYNAEKNNYEVIKLKNNNITKVDISTNELNNISSSYKINNEFNNDNKINKNYDKNILMQNDLIYEHYNNANNVNLNNMNNPFKYRDTPYTYYGKNKSHSRDFKKRHRKKSGLIEQIKKEQNEKKSTNNNNILYNTLNDKTKNIQYNNNYYSNYTNNNYTHFSNNINNCKSQTFFRNSINNNFETKNYLTLIRQKYLDYLIKIYGNDNISYNKLEDENDKNFMISLINNEIPIENTNLNYLNCSNDMKNFIYESLENFRLQQLKEKISNVDYNDFNIEKNQEINSNNNLGGLAQLDYEDENKEKNTMLEPLELDKGYLNHMSFGKFFVESLNNYNKEQCLFKQDNDETKQ